MREGSRGRIGRARPGGRRPNLRAKARRRQGVMGLAASLPARSRRRRRRRMAWLAETGAGIHSGTACGPGRASRNSRVPAAGPAWWPGRGVLASGSCSRRFHRIPGGTPAATSPAPAAAVASTRSAVWASRRLRRPGWRERVCDRLTQDRAPSSRPPPRLRPLARRRTFSATKCARALASSGTWRSRHQATSSSTLTTIRA